MKESLLGRIKRGVSSALEGGKDRRRNTSEKTDHPWDTFYEAFDGKIFPKGWLDVESGKGRKKRSKLVKRN